MASAYDYLTDSERVTYNETSRLMQLSDWDAWDDQLQDWLDVTQTWIRDRRAYISDLATGEVESGNGPGWDTCHRRERYDYLHRANYADAAPHAVCQLPTEAGTPSEKLWISLREMWWMNPSSAYSEQSARRQACTDWLIAQRKNVWNHAEGNVPGAEPGWNVSDRQQRYTNLQVATKAGSGYADWCETHDPATGQETGSGGGSSGGSGGSSRDKALSWMAGHRGCYESPGGSNCDSRSDGIRKAQDDCVKMGSSGTWLRNEPWCGVWCANAMEAAGVKGLSYNLASVAWIEDQAKRGGPPFTGWTTDGGKAQPGDLVIIGSYGGHVGMLRKIESSSTASVEEGNTSDTSALRSRSRSSEVRGYARVAYP